MTTRSRKARVVALGGLSLRSTLTGCAAPMTVAGAGAIDTPGAADRGDDRRQRTAVRRDRNQMAG